MASSARPPYGGTVIRSGSSGPDVAQIQTWLNGVRGRWPAIQRQAVDGRYGTATATAVKTFQTIDGIASDGAVGPTTWDRLYAAYAAQQGAGESYPGIALRSGHTGATVKSAQQKLQSHVPALVADGNFGPRTENAVRSWQTVNGLTVDGVIGPQTWGTLGTTMA